MSVLWFSPNELGEMVYLCGFPKSNMVFPSGDGEGIGVRISPVPC